MIRGGFGHYLNSSLIKCLNTLKDIIVANGDNIKHIYTNVNILFLFNLTEIKLQCKTLKYISISLLKEIQWELIHFSNIVKQ